LKGKIVLFP